MGKCFKYQKFGTARIGSYLAQLGEMNFSIKTTATHEGSSQKQHPIVLNCTDHPSPQNSTTLLCSVYGPGLNVLPQANQWAGLDSKVPFLQQKIPPMTGMVCFDQALCFQNLLMPLDSGHYSSLQQCSLASGQLIIFTLSYYVHIMYTLYLYIWCLGPP